MPLIHKQNAKIPRPFVVGWANFFLAYFLGGAIFFNALFCKLFFRESDITCIITVVGARQQHKGMFLKHGARGANIFQQCHGGKRFFSPRICEEGGGGAFFSPIDFAEPLPHPAPARP